MVSLRLTTKLARSWPRLQLMRPVVMMLLLLLMLMLMLRQPHPPLMPHLPRQPT